MAELRSDDLFQAEMRGSFAAFQTEMHRTMARMMWTMTIAMIGTVIASAGFAFTAGLAI